jgi:hypothetical protein
MHFKIDIEFIRTLDQFTQKPFVDLIMTCNLKLFFKIKIFIFVTCNLPFFFPNLWSQFYDKFFVVYIFP